MSFKMLNRFLITALALEAGLVSAFPHIAEQVARANAERGVGKSE